MSICVNKYADLGYAFVNIWHSTVLLLFSVVLCSDMYARNSQEVATFTKITMLYYFLLLNEIRTICIHGCYLEKSVAYIYLDKQPNLAVSY